MKRHLKIAAFYFTPFFVFPFCTFAAGDPSLLTVTPSGQREGLMPGEKVRDASAVSSPVAEKNYSNTGAAASEVKKPKGKVDGRGYTEFDDFNNVNDPLYREGSKVLLKKAIKDDLSPKTGKAELMRDAPADIPSDTVRPVPIKAEDEHKAPIFTPKKNRLIKLIPADPVKSKSTL
ncbi:MAG: hypothetical protein WCK75_03615 [Elusimicrobiota bacterium]